MNFLSLGFLLDLLDELNEDSLWLFPNWCWKPLQNFPMCSALNICKLDQDCIPGQYLIFDRT